MRIKKYVLFVLVCAVVTGAVGANAMATNLSEDNTYSYLSNDATGRINFDVDAGKIKVAGTAFSLAAGEIVTIDATYTPEYANMQFGLIGTDGVFYAMNGEDGEFYNSIKVPERGSYTFAVKNNSPVEVTVIGTINY